MKTKMIMIDDQEYVVQEVKMKDILPLMGNEDINLGVELVKLSVFKDGNLIGDDILEMGFGAFQKLMEASNDVNGVNDQGND